MKIFKRFGTLLKDYKFNSIFFKNFLMLLLLIMVPLMGTFGLSYYAYGNMQKNEMRAYADRLVSEVYADMERILKEIRTQMLYIGMNSNVELYFYDTPEIRQLNYKVNTIQELIKMPVLSKSYIDSIYVYSAKNGKVITLQGLANYDNFREKECLDTCLREAEKGKQICVTQGSSRGYEEAQLSAFQEIRYGSENSGMVVVNINMAELIKELDLPGNVVMYLTDEEGILFGSAGELGEGKTAKSSMESRWNEDHSLGVIVRFGLEGYHNQLTAVRNVLLVVIGMMTLVTLILSAVISVRIFTPIEKIMLSLKEYRGVLMGEEELFREKDELQYILSSIRKTASIKKDVDSELAERVRLLKKAQAVALQSQINPHFLNNTLDTINWMAIGLLGGKNEISQMTGDLSRMLRMTLENTDSIIPLKQEIEHCKYYLNIQKKRYEDKFQVIWEIPEEIHASRTIRIILQPLAENAIYHGVKHLSSQGLIRISGYLTHGLVTIMVEDNGLGMKEEEVKELNEMMACDVIRENRHIGISNVNQRLKLYFGEEYGIRIESREGLGTRVFVTFPHIREE